MEFEIVAPRKGILRLWDRLYNNVRVIGHNHIGVDYALLFVFYEDGVFNGLEHPIFCKPKKRIQRIQ